MESTMHTTLTNYATCTWKIAMHNFWFSIFKEALKLSDAIFVDVQTINESNQIKMFPSTNYYYRAEGREGKLN